MNLRIAGMTAYFKYTGFTDFEFKRAKEQKKAYCNNAINEEQYNKLINWLIGKWRYQNERAGN